MPLQTSGPISLSDIAAEFGGTPPHALSEYADRVNINPGNEVSLADFYGAADTLVISPSAVPIEIDEDPRSVVLSIGSERNDTDFGGYSEVTNYRAMAYSRVSSAFGANAYGEFSYQTGRLVADGETVNYTYDFYAEDPGTFADRLWFVVRGNLTDTIPAHTTVRPTTTAFTATLLTREITNLRSPDNARVKQSISGSFVNMTGQDLYMFPGVVVRTQNTSVDFHPFELTLGGS